jgi:hypothetical protein
MERFFNIKRNVMDSNCQSKVGNLDHIGLFDKNIFSYKNQTAYHNKYPSHDTVVNTTNGMPATSKNITLTTNKDDDSYV